GRALEPVVLGLYQEEQGVELEQRDPTDMIVHPGNPLFACTPDGLVVGGEKGVEAKAPLFRSAGNWGEAGTDDVPEYYLVQCQWNMMCSGRDLWDLAALIGDEPLAVYPMSINHELIAALREIAERFWRDHIINRVPPPADGSESTRAWLRQNFPEVKRPMLEPTPEALQLLADYRRFKPALDCAESDINTIKNQLMNMVGDAEGIAGVCTWRKSKDKTEVDWQEVSLVLGERLGVLPGTDEYDALVKAATITTPGERRFLFSNARRKKS
ncbi:MAG TPA: YqaJ viral recombinase family protein, partial [Candidatus Deferrimicrobiaceae bacterium]